MEKTLNTYRDRDDAREWLAAAERVIVQSLPDVLFAISDKA